MPATLETLLLCRLLTFLLAFGLAVAFGFGLRFRLALAGLGFSGRFAASAVTTSGFLRAFAGSGRWFFSVIGHVPARPFELHGWRREQLLNRAPALGTLFHRRIRKFLDALKTMATFLAQILVERHYRCSL